MFGPTYTGRQLRFAMASFVGAELTLFTRDVTEDPGWTPYTTLPDIEQLGEVDAVGFARQKLPEALHLPGKIYWPPVEFTASTIIRATGWAIIAADGRTFGGGLFELISLEHPSYGGRGWISVPQRVLPGEPLIVERPEFLLTLR